MVQPAEVAFPFGGFANSLGKAFGGRQEILVLARDAERAMKLLAERSV